MLLFFAALAMTGCGGDRQDQGPAQDFVPQISLFAVQGPEDSVFIPAALERTALEFLGPPRPAGAAASGGAPPLIRPDMLSPGSTTTYQRTQSQARALGIRAEHPLHANLSATARMTLGEGRSVYVLPQGLGVLRDPTTIRFDTRLATLESGLAWHQELLPGVAGTAEMALGLRYTQTRTHVLSALLDVRSQNGQRDGYIAFRGAVGLHPGPGRGALDIGAEARLFPGQGVTFGHTLTLRY